MARWFLLSFLLFSKWQPKKQTDLSISSTLMVFFVYCVLWRSVACSFFSSPHVSISVRHSVKYSATVVILKNPTGRCILKPPGRMAPNMSEVQQRKWFTRNRQAARRTEYRNSRSIENYLTTKLPSLRPATMDDAGVGVQSIHRSTPAYSLFITDN